MKKFLIAVFTMLFLGLNAYANWENVLNTINNKLNTIDQTEYTIERINNKVEKIQKTTKANSNKQNSTTSNTKSNNPLQTNYSTTGNGFDNTDDIPEFSVEQKQPAIQEGQSYNQDRIYKGSATTLGNLPAGTIVIDPDSVWKFRNGTNYSGDIIAEHPVFWRKLEDNHYANGSTLLLSDVKVAEYPFCHSGKGLRAWDESDIRRFLRTTFYTHLSTGFKSAITDVDIPYADLNGLPKTIKDNLFLLSIVEWGLSDRANNGSVIKYNDLPKIYGAQALRYYDGGYFNLSSMYLNSWTRTINRPKASNAGYGWDVFEIKSDGVLNTSWYNNHTYAVRPAVNLKSSTKVKGPYKFLYGSENKSYVKTLIYYVLDFSSSGQENNTSNSTNNTYSVTY